MLKSIDSSYRYDTICKHKYSCLSLLHRTNVCLPFYLCPNAMIIPMNYMISKQISILQKLLLVLCHVLNHVYLILGLLDQQLHQKAPQVEALSLQTSVPIASHKHASVHHSPLL